MDYSSRDSSPSFQYPRVGSLPRNLLLIGSVLCLTATFSIRESDRCLETPPTRNVKTRNVHLSVSASRIVASKLQLTRLFRVVWFFLSVSASRIVASKRSHHANNLNRNRNFQYPRVGSLPRNLRTPSRPKPAPRLSVSASRIVASKLSWSRHQQIRAANFQYPRVGSLPRNHDFYHRYKDGELTFSIRESDRCLETLR